MNQIDLDQAVQRERLDEQRAYFQTTDLLAEQRARRRRKPESAGLLFAAFVLVACFGALMAVAW